MENSKSREELLKKYRLISGRNFLEINKYLVSNFPNAENSYSIYFKYIKPELDRANLAIDIGCGRGQHLGLSRAKYRIGIDKVFKRVKYAALDHCSQKNISFVNADTYYLPIKDKACDVLLLNSVIEHIKYSQFVFKEFSRVVKKGGKLVIFTSNILNPFYFFNKLLSPFQKHLSYYLKKEPNPTPTYYKINFPLALDLKLRERNFKRVKLIYGIDPPLSLSNKPYLFFWRNLNKIFYNPFLKYFLPVFCAIYQKK